MLLSIKNLSTTYANGVQALREVSLEIPTGMFGLLGPNGAGKSTLMRILATLQEADSGAVTLGNLDVLKQKDGVRKILGYLPQEFGFYPKVRAQVLLDHFATLKGIVNAKERKELVEALLQRVNLWDARQRKLGEFSGGMRQRFGIAQVLLSDPKLIIVDEPTAGLDPAERNRFLNLLSEIGENVVVILSGKYEVKRDRHKNLAIEIYYDKKHPYNLDRMIAGVKSAFDYCTKNFGLYPYKTVKIVEVPDYGIIGGSARSQPTVFTWTENGGFISNLEDSTAIDVVFNTTTHEMAHQWWGHIVKAAEAEGAAVLAETMAQWVRVMCMQQMYGVEKTHRFRQDEMDDYLSSRARQQDDEPPLMRSTTQAYLNYDKGTLIMYALQDYIGETRVNAALRKLVNQFGFKEAPYPTTVDLLAALREVTPDSLQFVITDLFETITLYDNKVEEAKCTTLANGKFQVRLKTQTHSQRE